MLNLAIASVFLFMYLNGIQMFVVYHYYFGVFSCALLEWIQVVVLSLDPVFFGKMFKNDYSYLLCSYFSVLKP